MNPATQVLTRIARVQARSRRVAAVRAGAAFLIGAGSMVLASVAVLAWAPAEASAGIAAVFLAAALVTGVGGARRAWLAARPIGTPQEAAEAVAVLYPDRRQELEAAVDLARWGPEGARARGASPELVEAAVRAGAEALEGVAPERVVPWDPAHRVVGWGLAAAAAAALVLAGGPERARNGWARLVSGGEPAPVSVGNLVLELFPPGYTGLAPQRIEGSDGSFEAYPGTRVVLSGRLSRSVGSGVWEGPAGETAALELAGRGFRVSWLVSKAGGYRLRFWDGKREVPSDFGAGSVVLRRDRPPVVDLVEPEGDLERFRDQEIRVRFRARDDFRVESAEVVLQGEVEVRVPVRLRPGPSVEGEARILPLAHPELGAGAHLRVEARDGDTVSGPKAGLSRSVYVSFLDARKLRGDIENLEERLLDGVLEILADLLEAGPGTDLAPAREKARALLTLLDELAERVRLAAEDGAAGAVAVLGVEAGLRTALGPFADGGPGGEALVEELERDALFLDRLLRDLRMEEALGLGDEIAALQRSLFDDLQRGADPQDLVKRVEQIQDLVARMAEQLGRSAREMPDAFANADAVANMPRSELEEQLQQLRAALAAGDQERARGLAAQILETLSRWLSALEEAAQGAARQEADPVLAELGEAEAALGDLAAAQEKLLGQTRDVARDVSTRAWEEFQGSAREGFLARQEERLRRIEQAAREMAREAPRTGLHGAASPGGDSPLDLFEKERAVTGAARELRQALAEDWASARTALEALEAAVQDLRQGVEQGLSPESPARPRIGRSAETARKSLEAIRYDLDALARERLRSVSPEEAARLAEAARRQADLRSRAGDLAQRLEDLGRQTPFLDPEAAERVRSAAGRMGRAGGRLGQGDPFGAVPPQVGALEDLAGAAQRLRQARRRLEQAGQGGGMALLRRPGGRGMGRDVDRGPVEIPRDTEAQELRAFRQEVLRAMREGRPPPGYEEAVERYYERLIR